MKLEDIKAWAETLRKREIRGEDETLYLTRYDVRGWIPGDGEQRSMNVYLHHIHRADLDEALHSHPWEWAQTQLLHGCYHQTYGFLVDEKLIRAPRPSIMFEGSAFDMGPGVFHRITHVEPDTWTLFVTGPKASSWGFYVEGRGVVPWRDRLRERGIEPAY